MKEIHDDPIKVIDRAIASGEIVDIFLMSGAKLRSSIVCRSLTAIEIKAYDGGEGFIPMWAINSVMRHPDHGGRQ